MTQPTKPSQSSAGALRAASAIYEATWPKGGSQDRAKFVIADLSKIIDRETGVAELLEAAKMVGDKIDSDHKASVKFGGKAGLFFTLQELEQIEQAIAKCEGGE